MESPIGDSNGTSNKVSALTMFKSQESRLTVSLARDTD